MRLRFVHSAIFVATLLWLTACDESTSSLGIYPAGDAVTETSQTFTFTTRTIALDSIVPSTSTCYLGQVQDPETGATVKAEFAAQFHTFEDYTLPPDSQLVAVQEGRDDLADSIDLRLYYTSYYGDGYNPMKLSVYELDHANTMREDYTYYSDADLTAYLPASASPIATVAFTPVDYTVDASDRTASTYYPNVHIPLPDTLGHRILQAARQHPEFFRDSWQMAHHVLPGFYIKLESGNGTMLAIDVSVLNVFFTYHDVDADSTVAAIARFSATPEVMQLNSFCWQGLSTILTGNTDEAFTYLKTPAALATELTLPVDEIFATHEGDSISRARIVLSRINASEPDYALPIPQQLLMVRTSQHKTFFAERKVTDGTTSFISTYDATYNTYTYANIARLLSTIYREKQSVMREQGMSSEQYNAAYPDWNRVVLMPVATTTATNASTGALYYTSVTPDLSLTTARLRGGTQPQTMQVIYSRYQ